MIIIIIIILQGVWLGATDGAWLNTFIRFSTRHKGLFQVPFYHSSCWMLNSHPRYQAHEHAFNHDLRARSSP